MVPSDPSTLYACGAVGEMVADLERAGKRHAVITGVVEGGDPGVQAEIEDWCKAAQVRRRFRDTNIAQIGRPYPGMMDLYIDETNLYNRMFLYTKQFDWEKMWAIADDITDEEAIRAKAQDILVADLIYNLRFRSKLRESPPNALPFPYHSPREEYLRFFLRQAIFR